ncbi:hypothetical protein [Pantoea cypripedii]|uniref:Uncharacterized protein n=1 Tax=Pantoea cypripedii TaxID=55209 RepID=A0A1X1EMK2_PANCY|nr:hypothetical protein [Pantoea cypripedii]MBP2200529.1 hypothetical protein [Pantoea cypripedii]ORM90106.1 hypothetical protein HA50_26425 [Pantoea cypripedii]
MNENSENDEKGFTRTLTVRNVPLGIDIEIAEQASAAGKSKGDFLREFLAASFGDLIGNFMRSNGLVALMDRDVAKMMNARLADYWFDAAQTLAENRAWCRLLGIHKEGDLQRIMRDGVPLLEIRARQLVDVTHIPNGSSLAFALFAEAARRDLRTLLQVHRALFFLQKEEDFLDMVDQIREAQRLPPTERPVY